MSATADLTRRRAGWSRWTGGGREEGVADCSRRRLEQHDLYLLISACPWNDRRQLTSTDSLLLLCCTGQTRRLSSSLVRRQSILSRRWTVTPLLLRDVRLSSTALNIFLLLARGLVLGLGRDGRCGCTALARRSSSMGDRRRRRGVCRGLLDDSMISSRAVVVIRSLGGVVNGVGEGVVGSRRVRRLRTRRL
jgi:hypothetical protein